MCVRIWGVSAPIRRMYPDKTASVPLEGRIHLSGGERGGQSLSYIWNENISEEMSLRSFEKKE